MKNDRARQTDWIELWLRTSHFFRLFMITHWQMQPAITRPTTYFPTSLRIVLPHRTLWQTVAKLQDKTTFSGKNIVYVCLDVIASCSPSYNVWGLSLTFWLFVSVSDVATHFIRETSGFMIWSMFFQFGNQVSQDKESEFASMTMESMSRIPNLWDTTMPLPRATMSCQRLPFMERQ